MIERGTFSPRLSVNVLRHKHSTIYRPLSSARVHVIPEALVSRVEPSPPYLLRLSAYIAASARTSTDSARSVPLTVAKPQLASTHRPGVGGDLLAQQRQQMFAPIDDVLPFRSDEQGGELVTADPGSQIRGPAIAAQPVSHGPKGPRRRRHGRRCH